MISITIDQWSFLLFGIFYIASMTWLMVWLHKMGREIKKQTNQKTDKKGLSR